MKEKRDLSRTYLKDKSYEERIPVYDCIYSLNDKDDIIKYSEYNEHIESHEDIYLKIYQKLNDWLDDWINNDNIKLSEIKNYKNINLEFLAIKQEKKENFFAVKTDFKLFVNNKNIMLNPEKRIYFPGNNMTSEGVIHREKLTDYYLVIGQIINSDTVKIRFIYNPFINLLWLGAFILLFQFFIIKSKQNN